MHPGPAAAAGRRNAHDLHAPTAVAPVHFVLPAARVLPMYLLIRQRIAGQPIAGPVHGGTVDAHPPGTLGLELGMLLAALKLLGLGTALVLSAVAICFYAYDGTEGDRW